MAKQSSKKTTKQKSASSKTGPRQLRQPTKRFGLKRKYQKRVGASIPPAPRLFWASVVHVWRHRRLFLGITAIYLFLTLLLVQGFGLTGDATVAKEAINELIGGSLGQVAASLTAFGVLLGSGSPTTSIAAVYQAIILVLVSLATIWGLRQTYAKQPTSVKAAFYKSTYPLVPFLAVLLVLGVQLLPLLAANFLYGVTVGSGVVTGGVELAIWVVALFVLVLWSLYMIAGSLMASYIVTLPDMTPLKALRSAWSLVAGRRWAILRKLLFVPLTFGGLAFIVLLPIILLSAPLAEPLFIVLSALGVPLFHSYMYTLYRELIA